MSSERELIASLFRLLGDETRPSPARDLEIEIARDALKAFYRERGLYSGAEYFCVDANKQLVKIEPKASERQDGWSYKGDNHGHNGRGTSYDGLFAISEFHHGGRWYASRVTWC